MKVWISYTLNITCLHSLQTIWTLFKMNKYFLTLPRFFDIKLSKNYVSCCIYFVIYTSMIQNQYALTFPSLTKCARAGN